MSFLKRGLKGAPVKRLQEKLGIPADGDFGPGTEKAVKDFQKSHGLSVDGVAGPDTFTAMGLPELVLLRAGARGETVKKMQLDLGINADGKFGPGTKKAVMEFQAAHGLDADGIAGPATLAKMASFASVMTEETVKLSDVQADEEHFESEPLPAINGVDTIKATEEEVVANNSVWGKVKGWFS